MKEIFAVGGIILVDDDDFERFSSKIWRIQKHGYAQHGVTLLHREILGLKPGDGMHTDHINGNRLDCRKSNLRACSRQQNMWNRTSEGIDKVGKMWRARMVRNGRYYYFGRFETAELAKEFRDLAVVMLDGEFARM